MEGIINQQPEQQAPNLDPKEIKLFKEAYQLAKQFFYQEKVFDSLTAEAQKNPVKAIAGIVVTAMLRIQEKTSPFSLQVAAALGIALIDDATDTLEKAGVVQNSPELQTKILGEAINLWLNSNNYPPDQVASMMQEMGAPPEMVQQIQASQKPQGNM